MIKIYKEYLGGTFYFSKVFSYIILYLYNKENFFKKRTIKNDFITNYKRSFLLKRSVLREKRKRKSLVIHVATSEISYFFYHYFVYILLPKLNFLSDNEKRKIIENVYIIGNSITDEDVKRHVYNKISIGSCNIIFCNNILPVEKYDYTNTLALFLENTYFKDLFVNLQRERREKYNHLLGGKKCEYNCNIAKGKYYNLDGNKVQVLCNNFLYVSYFPSKSINNHNFMIVRRKKDFNSFVQYNNIIQNINANIKWINHSSFYKFYSTAYVSFLNYRMNMFQHFIETAKKKNQKKKKKNFLHFFFKHKSRLINSNIFFDFTDKKIIYLDFKHAAHLYIKFLHLLERVTSLCTPCGAGTPREEMNRRDSGGRRDGKGSSGSRNRRKLLVDEMRELLNVHVWTQDQKESFYENLANIKFRKFYN
ncbi:conserved Plasmodium protein, unknown function [Plasmodium ovale]|uniref:Uncharacterized protein n=1 Tax=Plasmodium ovale TaxID=36330 RepID=A0A1D3U7U7_PLAOA|nr:conserved Plasmodium protein, unknown function [Plasmodium ovale]